MSRQAAACFLGVAIALVLPACASKSRAPAAGPGTDYLRTYVGQQRVLRFQGDQARVVARRKDKPQLPGACDAAVIVNSAVMAKEGPRLVLDPIGAANADKARPRCRRIPAAITLALTGFARDSNAVVSRLDQILPTPEGYLRAYGISFDRPAGREPVLAAASANQHGASAEERRLEVRLTAPPRRLFWVDPIHRDARGAVKYEGEIEIEGVVGTDGRLYRTRVRGGLDQAHVATIQRALPMWRFEPARTGNDPTAAHVVSPLIFRID